MGIETSRSQVSRTSRRIPVEFDLPEAAALMSSLAVLGPTVSESAESAMRKLAAAVRPAATERG